MAWQSPCAFRIDDADCQCLEPLICDAVGDVRRNELSFGQFAEPYFVAIPTPKQR